VNSAIQLCPDQSSIPKMHFAFVPIADINQLNADDIIGKIACSVSE
jgi:hypothetical protein